MKILDSDHFVAILRGRLDLTGRVDPNEELAITAISVGELVHGAAKSQRAAENLARLDVLLAALTILPFDVWSARRFGQLKAELEQAGERISDLVCRSPASPWNKTLPWSHTIKGISPGWLKWLGWCWRIG